MAALPLQRKKRKLRVIVREKKREKNSRLVGHLSLGAGKSAALEARQARRGRDAAAGPKKRRWWTVLRGKNVFFYRDGPLSEDASGRARREESLGPS